MSRIENPILNSAIRNLRQAYKKSNSPIWLATMEYLLKSSARRPSVNVGKISRLTKEDDLILVPGKVLGGGIISHKVTVGAYSFSEKGSWKIQKAGGKAMSLGEFIEKFPDGKGVILIGG
ncbi:MAG: 50S ribosomal protein L18e [archaeon]|nr:50S ribosomal protein L18e [archaeon]MCP8315970.1 50S ribosomal protein L18e [archaeon]